MFNMRVKGYYTVEASLIVPLSTMIVIVMIFISFMEYDKCVIKQCVNQASIAASSNMIHSEKEKAQVANEEMKKLINDRLIAAKNIKWEISTDGIYSKVRCECEVNIPGIPYVSNITKNYMTIKVEGKAINSHQVKYIRMTKGY